MEKLQKALFDNQDKEYRVFQQKLMPGIELDDIIGVRLPVIRKIAKENAKTEDAKKFLDLLPHPYYDENQLHGFLINL
ncbi:MAG: DNA alkylation repair protein, partial [Lachnospiraceae bacterium]|nr:DNA alkylation repair protein [Lachnospiraceae bacterium]